MIWSYGEELTQLQRAFQRWFKLKATDNIHTYNTVTHTVTKNTISTKT